MPTFFSFLLQELKRIFHDEGLLIFLLLVPLGYPLLYTFIYNNETVREVPVVAVDMSDTSQSRQFLRMTDATPDVNIILRTNNMNEAKQLMRQGDAYGIIYLPSEFSRQLHTEQQTHITLYCDMSGLLYYKALLMACTDVALQMNHTVQAQLLSGATPREIAINTVPIRYKDIALYNPQTGIASFLIPAVLILIIQQTLLLGAGLTAGTDRDRRLPLSQAFSVSRLTARALAYLLVTSTTSAWILIGVPYLFSLPQLANATTLALFIFPYLLSCIFFALTLARLVPNREACMLLFVFTSVPLLFLSGISWPESNIPVLWKLFSWFFPSTFGINGYVRINSMGASLLEVRTEWFALWIQAGIYFLTALIPYKKLGKSKKHLHFDN